MCFIDVFVGGECDILLSCHLDPSPLFFLSGIFLIGSILLWMFVQLVAILVFL